MSNIIKTLIFTLNNIFQTIFIFFVDFAKFFFAILNSH